MSKYFNQLNYSMANEDSWLERNIVLKTKPKKILTVCGSGSRAFPLIHPGLEELHIVDLAKEQLWLAKLRQETIKKLSYQDYLIFWGYAPYKVNENCALRERIYLSLDLETNIQEYFVSVFNDNNWNSLLLSGKWEKTFVFFSKVVRKILGKKVCEKIFSFDRLDKQRDFFDKEFPKLKWLFVLSVLGNKSMFNALLYKGHFIKKNVDDSYIDYYKNAFNHLFTESLTKNSFFLQLCFLGEIKYAEGNLVEADEKTFKQMKKYLDKINIYYHQSDLIKTISNIEGIDFISLSDVPSYFSGELERSFYQKIKKSLSNDGVSVNRNYLRVPNAKKDGLLDISKKFNSPIKKECVQMYRVEVMQREF
jgi:S-adenosylmethionine-diacylglycerol 3-amino-3-carboxypropyl transferase